MKLKNYSQIILVSTALVACSTSPEIKEKKAGISATISPKVQVVSFINDYSMDSKKVSYAFGNQLRAKVMQQAQMGLNENQFISSFLEGKSNGDLNINQVSATLSQIQRSKGQFPDAKNTFSKNLGLYHGFNEHSNALLKKLDVVQFANGFKGVPYDAALQVFNSDSLYTTANNRFNEFLGQKFLEENRKQEGVKLTNSGLQYRVLKVGEGEQPNENSDVTVNYTGCLVNGKVFDSSVARGQPISFNLQGVIKGWTEGLQLMKTGACYRFYIPYALGYGERQASSIPAYSTLIFDVELLSFK